MPSVILGDREADIAHRMLAAVGEGYHVNEVAHALVLACSALASHYDRPAEIIDNVIACLAQLPEVHGREISSAVNVVVQQMMAVNHEVQ